MAKPNKQPRDDDTDAFREAVKGAQRLPDTGRVVHPPERPTPLPRQREQDDRQVLADSLSDEAPLEAALEAGEALAYVRDGMSPQVLRELRRASGRCRTSWTCTACAAMRLATCWPSS